MSFIYSSTSAYLSQARRACHDHAGSYLDPVDP